MTEYILTIGLIHQLTHIFSDNMAGNSNFKTLHLFNAYELAKRPFVHGRQVSQISKIFVTSFYSARKCKYLSNLTKTIF